MSSGWMTKPMRTLIRLIVALVLCATTTLWAAIPLPPDPFTAANSTILSNYNASWLNAAGQLYIQGNAVAWDGAVANSNAIHYWDSATDNFTDDQMAQATCVVLN